MRRLSLADRFSRRRWSAIGEHIRIPLYRNAYALLVSTLVSSGMGILYWFLAARLYSAEAVGANAAVISLILFVSGISQLNLFSALIRFLPRAGTSTRRFVLAAYGISVLLAGLVGSTIVVVVVRWHAKGLTFLTDDPVFTSWFVPSAMVWCIFALQDNALTGLRKTVWIPIENILYASGKIVLLVIFARSMPHNGILVSWMLPLVLAILPVNVLLFRRLIPAHARLTAATMEIFAPEQVARYVASDYLGDLFNLASTSLVPVLVTYLAGARQTAFFYVAWMIGNTLKLVPINMAASLTVEGSRNQQQLDRDAAHFLINLLRLMIPVIGLICLATPYVLAFFGSGYSTTGTLALRLLALSVLPNSISAVYISICRVERKMRGIMWVQGALCGMILVLTYAALKFNGVNAVGWAVLTSEVAVAAVVLTTRLRSVVALAFQSSPALSREIVAVEDAP